MKLVVDASVVVAASSTPVGLKRFRRFTLAAPPLLWVEVASALHAAMWRGELSRNLAESALERMLAEPIERIEPDTLVEEAWRIADEMGWAKTYDANYLALGRLLRCKVVTLDARMRRGADRLGFIVGPNEV